MPTDRILLGCKGASSSSTIGKLAQKAVRQDLLGVMVWFCRLVGDVGDDGDDDGDDGGQAGPSWGDGLVLQVRW